MRRFAGRAQRDGVRPIHALAGGRGRAGENIRGELAQAGIPQADIRPIAPSLEDVFVRVDDEAAAGRIGRRPMKTPFRGFRAILYQGVPRGLPRSDDAVLHVLPAADPDRRLWLSRWTPT